MPVEFLTDDEAAAYAGSPSRADLERAFFLDDEDRALVARRRGLHMRLGFALQLVTVRWLGTFLDDPIDVPGAVLDFVAEQLGVEDPSRVKLYTERRETPFDHQRDIRRVYGWKDFASAEDEFAQWVEARSWTSGDGPKAIFNDGVGWLRERKVLLPGVTTLHDPVPGGHVDRRRLAAARPADGDRAGEQGTHRLRQGEGPHSPEAGEVGCPAGGRGGGVVRVRRVGRRGRGIGVGGLGGDRADRWRCGVGMPMAFGPGLPRQVLGNVATPDLFRSCFVDTFG